MHLHGRYSGFFFCLKCYPELCLFYRPVWIFLWALIFTCAIIGLLCEIWIGCEWDCSFRTAMNLGSVMRKAVGSLVNRLMCFFWLSKGCQLQVLTIRVLILYIFCACLDIWWPTLFSIFGTVDFLFSSFFPIRSENHQLSVVFPYRTFQCPCQSHSPKTMISFILSLARLIDFHVSSEKLAIGALEYEDFMLYVRAIPFFFRSFIFNVKIGPTLI